MGAKLLRELLCRVVGTRNHTTMVLVNYDGSYERNGCCLLLYMSRNIMTKHVTDVTHKIEHLYLQGNTFIGIKHSN